MLLLLHALVLLRVRLLSLLLLLLLLLLLRVRLLPLLLLLLVLLHQCRPLPRHLRSTPVRELHSMRTSHRLFVRLSTSVGLRLRLRAGSGSSLGGLELRRCRCS